MRRYHGLIVAAGCILIVCSCNRGAEDKEVIAYVGQARITQEDVDLFGALGRIATAVQDTFALLTMDPVRGPVITEAIYQKRMWNPGNIGLRYGRQWKWKRRYYLAQMYKADILQKNCGFSDTELRGYYHRNREIFRTHHTIPSFDSVRFAVARDMFLSTCMPDSTGTDFSKPQNFRYFITDAYPEYFLKKFYREKYGKPFPDSLKDLYGKGRPLSEHDIQAAFPLLAPAERNAFKNNPLPFYRSLMQWKLFCERAVAAGFISRPKVKKTLQWAWKVEIAQRYVNTVLLPVVKKDIPVDSSTAIYSYYDEAREPIADMDSNKLRRLIARLVFQKKLTKFDSIVHQICRHRRVMLVPDPWKEVIGGDPAVLRKRANSLRDVGDAVQAQRVYSILAANYVFTDEGREACIELANIQAEQPANRLEAIKNYRRFLLSCADVKKQSEVMYIIGFIYDRYLNKPDRAELHYRWVLKNSPGSQQALDAEIMMLHLGEPMPSGDDLLVEAKRQGK